MNNLLMEFQLRQCLISGKFENMYGKCKKNNNEDMFFDALLELSYNISYLATYAKIGYNFTLLCSYLSNMPISDENLIKLHQCVDNYNQVNKMDNKAKEYYEINVTALEARDRNLKEKKLVSYDASEMYPYLLRDYEIIDCLMNDYNRLALYNSKYVLSTISMLTSRYSELLMNDSNLNNNITNYLSDLVFKIKFDKFKKVDMRLFTKTCEDFEALQYSFTNDASKLK